MNTCTCTPRTTCSTCERAIDNAGDDYTPEWNEGWSTPPGGW